MGMMVQRPLIKILKFGILEFFTFSPIALDQNITETLGKLQMNSMVLVLHIEPPFCDEVGLSLLYRLLKMSG